MRSPTQDLMIPRDAPVYAADGVRLGVVNSVGMQSLRVRHGRLFTRYLDVPVSLVSRVEHGGVWLSKGVNATLEAARPVASATAPDSPARIRSAESSDGDAGSDGTGDTLGARMPYGGRVYDRNGGRLGTVVDATGSALIVRVGAPWTYRIALPFTIVDRVEDAAVWLTVSHDDAKRIGAGVLSPPAASRPPRFVRTGEPAEEPTETAAD